MKLRHIHFPSLTPYATASRIQDHHVSRLLAHKAAVSASTPYPTQPQPQPPPPTILTFEFPPTYTAGLRSTNRLTTSDLAHLRAQGTAHFAYAPRGGQTTFHGPGQLVAYPVLDLRRHGPLSARCYVDLLQRAVVGVCGVFGVVGARTTGDVGVWVPGRAGPGAAGEEEKDDEEKEVERKICAVGVHLRRHVSSHGIGFNVTTDLGWFERIVACGLEGKEATSLLREGVTGVTVSNVAEVFVQEMARRLQGIDGVEHLRQTPEDYPSNTSDS